MARRASSYVIPLMFLAAAFLLFASSGAQADGGPTIAPGKELDWKNPSKFCKSLLTVIIKVDPRCGDLLHLDLDLHGKCVKKFNENKCKDGHDKHKCCKDCCDVFIKVFNTVLLDLDLNICINICLDV